MLRSTAAGGVNLFLIPSRPAANNVAITKYGFAAGSTLRTSTRVLIPRDAGIRTNGLRFCADHAT